jgi:LacI family transcriptional regulator
MGYTSNPLVSALMGQIRANRQAGSQVTIAVFCPSESPNLEKPRTATGWYEGARERAAQLGYTLSPFAVFDPEMPLERLHRVIKTRGISSILVMPLGKGDVHLPDNLFADRASATIGHWMRSPEIHRVETSHYLAAHKVCEQLARRGYRRPLLVSNLAHHRGQLEQLTASLDWWGRSFGLEQVPPLIVEGLPPQAPKKFHEALKQHQPDVLISGQTMGPVADWCAQAGARVPRDLALVTTNKWPGEPYAGVHLFPEMMGAAAVDLIDGQLRRNEYGLPAHPKMVILENEWQDGETLPCKADPA